ncbi:hypothetical protein EYV94_26465 [Puteibacter caeruleilacunae]|nr:hypothetical protein EYV94_26465 [Puteibacter caeruleilacunae]
MRQIYRTIQTVICALLIAIPAVQAQEITAKAILDTTNIMLGDQIKFNLELEKPLGFDIQFPAINDSLLTPNIEILEKSDIDTVALDNNRQKITQQFVITSFDSGSHVIPEFYFRYQYDQLADSLKSNTITLNVHSFDIDLKKGITDIKKPYEAPVTLKEVTPYIMGAILIVAILFFIFYAIRRRQKNMSLFSKPPKPSDPPHVVALKELDRIRDEKLWEQEKLKLYYSDITDTLRRYIEGRYHLSAMESTTDEILEQFESAKKVLDKKSFQQLKDLLQLADLVKFAKFKPQADDNSISLANAYFFVNQTKEEIKKEEPVEDDREGEVVELK